MLEEFRVANEEKKNFAPKPKQTKSLDDLKIFPPETLESSIVNPERKKKKDKVRRAPKMLDDFDSDQKLIETVLEEEIDIDSEFEEDERLHSEQMER